MRTIATVGGLGNIPVAPGTIGSAVGLGVVWILSGSFLTQVVGIGMAVVLSLWSAGPTAQAMGKEDPASIIIDEVAGMMVGAAFLPVAGSIYGAAFLLFRFFDVFKPPPIRQIQRLPGSWGILMDDLLAGLAANLCVRGLMALHFLPL